MVRRCVRAFAAPQPLQSSHSPLGWLDVPRVHSNQHFQRNGSPALNARCWKLLDSNPDTGESFDYHNAHSPLKRSPSKLSSVLSSLATGGPFPNFSVAPISFFTLAHSPTGGAGVYCRSKMIIGSSRENTDGARSLWVLSLIRNLFAKMVGNKKLTSFVRGTDQRTTGNVSEAHF